MSRCCALLLGSAAAAAASDYSPAFFWSPKKASGAASGLEHLSAVSGVDVGHTSTLLADGAREVQLVFLAEGMSTDAVRQHGDALPTLDGLLKKSASSLTMPFTTAHDSELFAQAPRVRADEAEQYFETHAAMLSNGVRDTVVVELPAAADASAEAQLAAHDAHIQRVTRAVDAGTGGNYAALLTATRRGGARRRMAKAAPVAYLHTTPTLLAAQVIVLLLIVIFLAGFCCLFSLQTPKRFEDTSAKAQ